MEMNVDWALVAITATCIVSTTGWIKTMLEIRKLQREMQNAEVQKSNRILIPDEITIQRFLRDPLSRLQLVALIFGLASLASAAVGIPMVASQLSRFQAPKEDKGRLREAAPVAPVPRVSPNENAPASPEVTRPSIPTRNGRVRPNVSTPASPEITRPSIPTWNEPVRPNASAPTSPKVSRPSIPTWNGSGIRLRIVAANLSSGNGQNYNDGHGSRILLGLKPDIVLIQEFNVGDGSQNALRKWVSDYFGSEFKACREDGNGIPNGIISRFPIVEQGEWDDLYVNNCDFAWAKLGLPNGQKLWAISVHLSHGRSEIRAKQAGELVNLIEEKIPKQDLVVLGGDLNTRNRKEECIKILSKIFETKSPYPADNLGDEDTDVRRHNPYDWVLADAELHPLMVGVKIGSQYFENGLVFDSRVFEPLGDVDPVEEYDSDAPQMQHMAVVKDFVLK